MGDSSIDTIDFSETLIPTISIPKLQNLFKSELSKFSWIDLFQRITDFLTEQGCTQIGINALILKGLGFEELIGYSGQFDDFPKEIMSSSDYEKLRESVYPILLQRCQDQLKSGGSTLFFDTEKLAKTESSILVPILLEARLQEINELVLRVSYRYEVDLTPLWLTSYGFSLAYRTDLYPVEFRPEINPQTQRENPYAILKRNIENMDGSVNFLLQEGEPATSSWNSPLFIMRNLWKEGMVANPEPKSMLKEYMPETFDTIEWYQRATRDKDGIVTTDSIRVREIMYKNVDLNFHKRYLLEMFKEEVEIIMNDLYERIGSDEYPAGYIQRDVRDLHEFGKLVMLSGGRSEAYSYAGVDWDRFLPWQGWNLLQENLAS